MIENHEIRCPEDNAIRSFLWDSYFHDSNISKIELKRHGKMRSKFPDRVELTILSSRDIDDDKRIPDSHREAQTYINENAAKYTYRLIFENCWYLASERLFFCNGFLYGVFLDSALLRNIQASQAEQSIEKKYYHYRIVFDDGYMDLIFSKFRIQKMAGRLKYPQYEMIIDYPEYVLKNAKGGSLIDENDSLDVDAVKALAETGSDKERCYAMIYLIQSLGITMIDIAREMMKLGSLEFHSARDAAIWAIGLQGDISDIPMLLDQYFSVERDYQDYQEERIRFLNSLLPKRQILDAMELIKSRR